VPPTKPSPRPRAVKGQDEAEAVFTYVQTVSTLSGRLDVPGPSSAAVTAAVQAGHRVDGRPTAEITQDVERMQATVTWSVPVKAV